MDALRESLPLALVGMAIVFGVLALIAAFVRLIRGLDERWQAREAVENEEAVRLAPTIDRTTLVLISAAVVTVLGARARVRHVRRLLPIDSPRSPWALQGRVGLQGSHAIPRKRDR